MTVLVIDIGSSSARAMLFDEALHLVAGSLCSLPLKLETPVPGALVADPHHVQTLIETCIDQVLAHPRAAEVRAVGMTTFVGNLIGIRGSEAVTPIFTYGDTRSDDDVLALADAVDLSATYQRTGCPHNSAYAPGRLRWLRRADADTFAAVEVWADLGAYLLGQWFGRMVTSYSVASWNGLLDRAHLTWDAEWLRVLEMTPDQFPPLVDYTQPFVGLRPTYAARWPALREVPFYPAVGDGAAANVGSGAVTPSHAALTVGTTAALRVITDAVLPPVPRGLWSYRVDAQLHLIGGATSEGGNIFRWARSTLQITDDVETQLLHRPADVHGLTILPLLAGERSPGFAANANGAIVGLTLATTPLDIAHALLESVALRLALVAEQLAPLTDAQTILIGGGGALLASRAWAQMIANALDRPLQLTAEPEITARGVALLTLRAQGLAALHDYPPAVAAIIEPRADDAARLRAARERQTALYRQLILGL